MAAKNRTQGAQPGNLNALKHGFYSQALKHAAQLDLDNATLIAIDDLSGEMALIRQRILVLLEASPENLELLCLAARSLANLARTQYHLKGSDAAQLAQSMNGVIASLEQAMTTRPEPKIA